MKHPSLETLKEISAEDWSQRYRSSYLYYDKGCQYCYGIHGSGLLYLTNQDDDIKPVREDRPQDPVEAVDIDYHSHLSRGIEDYVSDIQDGPIFVQSHANIESLMLAVGWHELPTSWFWRELDERRRDFVWTEIYKYLAVNTAIPTGSRRYAGIVGLWTARDYEEFTEAIANATNSMSIAHAGFAWHTTSRVSVGLTLYNLMHQSLVNIYERNSTQIIADHRTFRTIPLSPRIRDKREIQPGTLINLPRQRPEVLRPFTSPRESTYVSVREALARRPNRDNPHIVWPDERQSLFARAAPPMPSIEKVIKIELDKLRLDRPASRWFMVGDKPHFICYTNVKQFKRGLTPSTAMLYRTGSPYANRLSEVGIKQGCDIYSAAYDYKNPDPIRRTTGQLIDELAAKKFVLFNPYFILNGRDFFYKNVNLGSFDKGVFKLGNTAFSQEIAEFIYNPKIESRYDGSIGR